MPTITCKLNDLSRLVGTTMTVHDLENRIALIKGEVKGYDPAGDELKIELQDTNRPDLWTVEGIARQLLLCSGGIPKACRYLDDQELPVSGEMIIDSSLDYRPFAGAIIVRNVDVSNDFLIGLIQTQEKLANNFGRNRKSLSIGIYDFDQIVFPVYYKAIDRNELKFVPLDWDVPMTPGEILEKHAKGIEYAAILEGQNRVPILIDGAGSVLSFPPIINSRASGEVKTGFRNLFIEATGTVFMQLILALNILAADMADRGGEIEAVRVRYQMDTPFGRDVIMPVRFRMKNTISTASVTRWLGMEFPVEKMRDILVRFGYRMDEMDPAAGTVTVSTPAWRQDLLHPVDIVEDLAISVGYNAFIPEMPSYFTVGKIDPGIAFEDRVRDTILAFGYEEVISNILCNRDEFAVMVREPDRPIVEISNPMNIKFASLRDRILPSLLRVERDSSQAQYPHRIFETGEVTVRDDASSTGCRTQIRVGVLIADREAEFSHVHSCLESLLFSLGQSSRLVQEDIPVFLPGRAARVTVNGHSIGWIGELHPEVLENYSIAMPCAAFELDLDLLRDIIDRSRIKQA